MPIFKTVFFSFENADLALKKNFKAELSEFNTNKQTSNLFSFSDFGFKQTVLTMLIILPFKSILYGTISY